MAVVPSWQPSPHFLSADIHEQFQCLIAVLWFLLSWQCIAGTAMFVVTGFDVLLFDL